MSLIKFSFKGSKCDLCAMMRCLCGGKPAEDISRVVTYQYNGVSFTTKGDNMSFTAKVTEVPGTVDVSLVFKDAEGNVVSVDAPPQWTASEPAVIDTITAAADGLSAKIHLTNTVGASQLTVDAMENGSPLQFVDTVSILEGDAVAAEFTFGAVTPDGAAKKK